MNSAKSNCNFNHSNACNFLHFNIFWSIIHDQFKQHNIFHGPSLRPILTISWSNRILFSHLKGNQYGVFCATQTKVIEGALT